MKAAEKPAMSEKRNLEAVIDVQRKNGTEDGTYIHGLGESQASFLLIKSHPSG